MSRIFFSVFCLSIFCCSILTAQAQTPLDSGSDAPLEITADESLEWMRNELMFVAKKNALAKQGDVSVAGDTLTANYREGAGSGMEIWRVTADGSVVVHSKDSDAHGDRATYNLDEGLAVMTGKALKMVSVDQIVTARESFEYWVTDGKLVAVGKARAERKNEKGETTILEADKITATMKDNAKGQRVLHTLEATGNVVITSATEVLTGAYAIYKAETNKADLTGGVTLKRGLNVLEGEKAEVDLTTNTSRMFGGVTSPSGPGRVRGVFYPSANKKPQ